MSVRAYDPTLGRFLARDPLGRTPLVWANQPYGYAGNNPLRNVDPSGQFIYDVGMSRADIAAARKEAASKFRIYYQNYHWEPDSEQIKQAWIRYYLRGIAEDRVMQDVGNLVFDSGLMIVDSALGASGAATAWVSALTDLTAVGADIAQWVKDDSILNGNMANAEGARQWASVLNSLNLIANAINIIVQGLAFFFNPVKDLLKESAKKFGVALAARLWGVFGSGKKINTAWTNLSINALEARIFEVEHMSPNQLRQRGFPPNN